MLKAVKQHETCCRASAALLYSEATLLAHTEKRFLPSDKSPGGSSRKGLAGEVAFMPSPLH